MKNEYVKFCKCRCGNGIALNADKEKAVRRVYLAGAMSCYFGTAQQNYPKRWRDKVKEYVRKFYDKIIVISPTDFCKDYYKSQAEVRRFGLRMIREADIILVNLKDIHTSLDTSDEIFYSFIKGKPVIGFLEDESDYKNIPSCKMEQIDRVELGENALKKALNYINRYYV